MDPLILKFIGACVIALAAVVVVVITLLKTDNYINAMDNLKDEER